LSGFHTTDCPRRRGEALIKEERADDSRICLELLDEYSANAETWIKELCNLERRPFTLNDTHYEYIKESWRQELTSCYETEVARHQVIHNVRGVRERFQEVQAAARPAAATTTALIVKRPPGDVRLVEGDQQAVHGGLHFSQELEVFAGVLAYFEISIIRTIDYVTMAIREKLVQKMAAEVENNLLDRLGLQGEDGEYFTLRYGLDTAEIMERRCKMFERRDMLSKGMKELKKVERKTRDV